MSRDEQVGQRHLVDRVFSILDAFTPGEPRLTVSDISRRTLLPVATAHRLANQLANEGALDRGSDGRYGIGLRLLEIGRLEQHALQLRSVALPWMFRLQEATGSLVLLCVLSGDDVVVLEQVAVGVHHGFPPRQEAEATAAGRLLLAHRSPGSGGSVVCPSGLVFGGTQAGDEPFSVAAPVRDEGKSVTAALSIVGLVRGHERVEVAQAVRQAAVDISSALAQRATVVSAS
jgi:DNA-binding IclR family transcriptional regulator